MGGGRSAIHAAVTRLNATATSMKRSKSAESVSRTRILENEVGLVECLCVSGPAAPLPRAESYSPDYQVCLPYRGAFVWHVGKDDVVADPNRVLFVTGGEGFRVSQPIDGGYAELIVTVEPRLLSAWLGLPERQLPCAAAVSPSQPARWIEPPTIGRRGPPPPASAHRSLRRGMAGELPSDRVRGRNSATGGRAVNHTTRRSRQGILVGESGRAGAPLAGRACSRRLTRLSHDRVPAPRGPFVAQVSSAAPPRTCAHRAATRVRPHRAGLRTRLLESQPLHRGVSPCRRLHAVEFRESIARRSAPTRTGAHS